MLSLAYSVHELNASFPIMEDDRVKNSDFRQWSNLEYTLGDNSVVAFTANNDLIEIGPV